MNVRTPRPPTARQVKDALKRRRSAERAKVSLWFFKTGPGEYGEGDKFLGITTPDMRRVAKEFRALPLREVENLLHSPWHEERQTALVILTEQFKRGDVEARKRIFDLYLANTAWVNNWDLVDISAYHIVGPYLHNRSRKILDKLARSKSLWERRIAIISTMAFIREEEFADTLRLSRVLLQDPHDLMHKAVGWMLREVGNRDRTTLEDFLRVHYRNMPRTMLRYAIEKLPPARRVEYLKGLVR